MAEFVLVAKATASPTFCFFCSDFTGPFIDTKTDALGHGNIYVCAPREDRTGCVGMMAILSGMMSEVEVRHLLEKIKDLQAQVKELTETQMLQVSASEMKEMLRTPRKKVEA